MRKRPGQVDELFVDWGETGETIGATVLDGEDTVIAARATGFVEDGNGGYVLADYEFPDTRGTYRIQYDNNGGVGGVGHVVYEDLEIVSSTGEPFDGDTYGTVEELFRLLKINNPTDAQTDAATRVLTTATGEIDSEIDRAEDDPIAGWQISLATEVCLERAVELWRAAPFGIVDLGGDFGATHTARNTWERYAHMLAPLKTQWGIA